MLTEYFYMCQKYETARKFLYKEFPQHYVWGKQLRIWKERKKGVVVSRIVGANPREGEIYYLRLLLNHVRGPTSFEYLLTVNGKRLSSFKEAAREIGLLDSDQSVVECLDEAVSFEMPNAFRRLFATLLMYCEPIDVRKLWEDYSHVLSEDYRKDEQPNLEYHIQCSLRDIKVFLESMGKQITMYDLPIIKPMQIFANDCNTKDILDERSIIVSDEDIQASSKLNEDQKLAYDIIVQRIMNNKSGVFFIDGPGGTGKTFLYRALLATIRSRGMIAIATATSGVAASIMPGGRTTHSRFNIPLQAIESSMQYF
ncbi:uncharacterized protein LOC111020056 [Momordica charantia]|uniref:ATP-dependent DNA helicase n=1 Tax=Momordica charantia TaxID=3673 RepID=A0A6J1DEI7_MOMCH|nr:uncharacterized protein LOC111020056 [Momordica charantia]